MCNDECVQPVNFLFVRQPIIYAHLSYLYILALVCVRCVCEFLNLSSPFYLNPFAMIMAFDDRHYFAIKTVNLKFIWSLSGLLKYTLTLNAKDLWNQLYRKPTSRTCMLSDIRILIFCSIDVDNLASELLVAYSEQFNQVFMPGSAWHGTLFAVPALQPNSFHRYWANIRNSTK